MQGGPPPPGGPQMMPPPAGGPPPGTAPPPPLMHPHAAGPGPSNGMQPRDPQEMFEEKVRPLLSPLWSLASHALSESCRWCARPSLRGLVPLQRAVIRNVTLFVS